MCLHSLVNIKANGEFESRLLKTRDVFTRSRLILTNFTEFSPDYEGMENIIYFFYEENFRLNNKKNNIRSVYV